MAEQPSKRRLFVGTFLAQADKQRIATLLQYDARLAQLWQREIRWIGAEKLHLTWLFIGHVEPRHTATIVSKLAAVLQEQRQLQLTYSRPLLWPSASRARHGVLCSAKVPAPVQDLRARIKTALAEYLESEQNDVYRPHVTLFRLRAGAGGIAFPDWFPVQELLPLVQPIREIELIESHVGSGAASYVSLHKYQLL